MDEPLSNLDAKLRAETRSQIVRLQRQLGKTTIYVTHDQTEAMTMGDRIAVMYGGQIQQVASPLEIYHHPVNTFVAQFIGSPPMNFVPVRADLPTLTNGDLRVTLPNKLAQAAQKNGSRNLLLGIRPEHLELANPDPAHLHGRVELIEALGTDTFITVQLAGLQDAPSSIQARISPEQTVQNGQEVSLSLTADKIHLFDPQTTLAI
jgi:multiple sugar transport system ATP-binding protein